MKKLFALLITHGLIFCAGFAAGVYYLPILIAPEAPTSQQILAIGEKAPFTGSFSRELKDSDHLHWAEGTLFVTEKQLAFHGLLSPGPDYKVYLSPEFIETEADFHALKSRLLRIGQVDTFENFIIDVPSQVDIHQFNTVIIWCESFGQFISAARFR